MLRKLVSPALALSIFFVCALASHAQFINTNITIGVSTIAPVQGEPVTVTATITVSSGPVSALNGLLIEFDSTPGSGAGVPINNGVASTIIHPGCGGEHGCENYIFASFLPQGNFGPAYAMTTIQAEAPANLQGQYAFHFEGKGAFGGAPTAVAAVGSMTFNGGSEGSITGIEDVNTGLGAYQKVAISGTYTTNALPMGTFDIVLQSSLGTQHLQAFTSYSSDAGIENPFITAQSATFIETDAGPISGKGEMTLQVPGGYAGLNTEGAFLLNLAGETACTVCSSYGHGSGAVFAVGSLALEYAPAVGGGATTTETVAGESLPTVTTPATFVAPDGTGRTLFTLTPTNSAPSDQPTHFVGYAVNSAHFYLMSLDSHAKAILLTGKAYTR